MKPTRRRSNRSTAPKSTVTAGNQSFQRYFFSLTLALFLIVAMFYGSVPVAAATGVTTFSSGSTVFESTSPTGTPTNSSAANQRQHMLAPGTPYATPYYINEGPQSGPTVVVVGGVHGNEIAGYHAARRFIDVIPKRGTLIVIPEANRLGIESNARNGGHPGDLNRDFPRSRSGKPQSVLAESIWEVMQKHRPDYLFDLHEGYDFHRLNSNSVGQTIIYYPTGNAKSMAQTMQQAVNASISRSGHRFALLRYPIQGSLARAAGIVFGTKAMILETSRKQTLDTRITQHVTMVNAALERLEMR